jgi:hypothetical protein
LPWKAEAAVTTFPKNSADDGCDDDRRPERAEDGARAGGHGGSSTRRGFVAVSMRS